MNFNPLESKNDVLDCSVPHHVQMRCYHFRHRTMGHSTTHCYNISAIYPSELVTWALFSSQVFGANYCQSKSAVFDLQKGHSFKYNPSLDLKNAVGVFVWLLCLEVRRIRHCFFRFLLKSRVVLPWTCRVALRCTIANSYWIPSLP